MADAALTDFFTANGYAVARQVFSAPEVESLKEHFMKLRAAGDCPGDLVAETKKAADPLTKYPRMIHMHRWDPRSHQWMMDSRLLSYLDSFFGCETFGCQTMLYFKPPGARGQALHQDNYYLRVRPGTCVAAWMALDDCDELNGCMQVVPGSHEWPTLCPQKADTAKSFTDVTVGLPAGKKTMPVIMAAGDVLFFNGSIIHGSLPNVTADRFRRSLIGHYICERAEYLTAYDQPVVRRDGTELRLNESEDGGACGVWVDVAGKPVLEMTGTFSIKAGVGE